MKGLSGSRTHGGFLLWGKYRIFNLNYFTSDNAVKGGLRSSEIPWEIWLKVHFTLQEKGRNLSYEPWIGEKILHVETAAPLETTGDLAPAPLPLPASATPLC